MDDYIYIHWLIHLNNKIQNVSLKTSSSSILELFFILSSHLTFRILFDSIYLFFLGGRNIYATSEAFPYVLFINMLVERHSYSSSSVPTQ